MTENDKFTLKEFLRGFVFTFGCVGSIILIVMLSGGKNEILMKPHAEVVDTYK